LEFFNSMFSGCISLTYLTDLPKSIKNKEFSYDYTLDNIFYNNFSLLEFPDISNNKKSRSNTKCCSF